MTDMLKYPGSAATIARHLERRIRDGSDASVPCNGCNACCRSKILNAEVRAAELERFPDAVWSDKNNSYVLPKLEDGSCTRLIDGRCSVYSERPKSCSAYDCRFHLLIGKVPDSNDPVMQEAVLQWEPPGIKTNEDVEALLAHRFAVRNGGAPADIEEAKLKALHWREHLPAARLWRQSASLSEHRAEIQAAYEIGRAVASNDNADAENRGAA